MQTFNCEIEYDENGEVIVPLPEPLLQELGWNQYTILETKLEDKKIILTRKTEWSVDELQSGDNLEMVMEDVINNQSKHYINYEGGRYVIAPVLE